MAEEQTFGVEAVEQAQGYERLKPAAPEGASLTVEEAAAKLSDSRPASPPDVTIKYEKDGKPLDGKFSITLEEAAHDLSEWHKAQAEKQQVRDDVDLLRAVSLTYQERGEFPTEQPAAEAEAEAPAEEGAKEEAPKPEAGQEETPQAPDNDGLDAKLREAFEHPKVIEALEQEFGVLRQAREETYKLSSLALFGMFPEMASLSAEQMPVALSMLATQNPQRHAQITRQLQVTQAAYVHHVEAERAQAAQQRQQFTKWASEQDQEFEKEFNKEFRGQPGKMDQTRQEVTKYLTETIGIPKAELAELWHNNPAIRSAQGQRIMCDAARHHMAKEKARNATRVPLPPVQRPGVSRGRPDHSETIAELQSKLKGAKGEPALRLGAQLILARRAQRGR